MRSASKIGAAVVAIAAVGGVAFNYFDQSAAIKYGSRAYNYVRYLDATDGTFAVERNASYQPPAANPQSAGTPQTSDAKTTIAPP